MKFINYYKKFVNVFNPLKIFFYSIVTITFITLLDSLNIIREFIQKNAVMVTLIGVFLLVLLTISVIKFIKDFILSYINKCDYFLHYFLFCNLLCFVGYLPFLENAYFVFSINIWIYVIILFPLILLILLRPLFLAVPQINNKNVYSLYELLNGKVNNGNFSLSDTPIENDTFGRESIIDELEYCINELNFDGQYVISLTGEWGSGKTTLLNIVKKRVCDNDKLIIIDDFDPWLYSDEVSMFKAVLNKITTKLRISSVSTMTLINRFVSNYISDPKIKIPLDILNFNLEEEKLIKIINDKLLSEGKKIVLIMDNIDRANDENILLIYKLISAILKINNILYVLSYDPVEINNVFVRKGINPKFLDKIIQKNIDMPRLDYNKLNVAFVNALLEVQKIYSLDLSETIYNYNSLKIDIFKNIREIILFLNNILFTIRKNYGINISDYILLMLIKEKNIELYNEIKNNPFMFLTTDKHYMAEYSYVDSSREVEKIKKYLESLFSKPENKKYENIIKKMFPSIDYISRGYSGFETHNKELNNKKSIASGKYFSTYFLSNFNENEFLKASLIVDDVIKNVNYGEDIEKSLYKLFHLYKNEDQKEIYLMFRNNFENIKGNYKFETYKFLVKHSNIFEKYSYWQNAYLCNVLFVAEFVCGMNENEFLEILSYFKNFNKLDFNRQVIYYSKKFREEGKEISDVNIAALEKLTKELVDDIINQNVDIYLKENYSRQSIFIFEKNNTTKTFLKNILNKNNILIFIKDFIGYAIGNRYSYYIHKNNILEYIDYDYLKILIESVDENQLSEDLLFVLRVFKSADFSNLKERDFDERKDAVICNERVYF